MRLDSNACGVTVPFAIGKATSDIGCRTPCVSLTLMNRPDRNTTALVDARYETFTLDPYQREAVDAVRQRTNVVVAAPTGAGKTLVAEHAVSEALGSGGRAFYTTPIKALSNQKFRDFSAIWGEERVGILTGDNSVRPEASVVVMTTEVLRNMLIEGRAGTTDGLSWVILDEAHYLSDPYRGAVWEEVLIHSPEGVNFVCLSATISNADQFGQWVKRLRGGAKVVTSGNRPVPMKALHMVYDKSRSQLVAFPPTDKKGKPHPESRRIENHRYMSTDSYDDYDREWRFNTPSPRQVVEHLRGADLLPAIYFVFSRDGCDSAALRVSSSTETLTTEGERWEIEQIARSHLAALSELERADAGAEKWLERLKRGVGAHHAGLVPVFKEAVEECFAAGLVKVVFATETLALGINMPARTVVVDKLTKWNGTGHAELTPAQFTQLSGRAGRRGIDKIGHVVTLWSSYVSHRSVVDLHASKSFKLDSAFEPNYNMTANLVAGRTRDEAHAVLSESFAQFLIDQKTSAQRRSIEQTEAKISEYEGLADSPHGDMGEYLEMQRTENDAKLGRVSGLRRGDVLADPTLPGECMVFIQRMKIPRIPKLFRSGMTSLRCAGTDGKRRDIRLLSFPTKHALKPVGRVELPTDISWKRPKLCLVAGQALARAALEATGRPGHPPSADHPVSSDPLLEKRVAARRQLPGAREHLSKQRAAMRKKLGRLAKRFDQIVEILDGLGYIREWDLTNAGRMLAAIHGEQGLLVCEAIRSGVLDELDAAELAAVVSVFVYEQRGRTGSSGEPAWPNEQCSAAAERIQSLREGLRRKERPRGLDLTPESANCTGFFNHAYAWAHGASLSQSTGGTMSHGDFIRNIRMLADMLRQIAGVAPDGTLATRARESIRRIARGVVVADSMSRTLSPNGTSPSNSPIESSESTHLPVVLDAIAGRRSRVETLTRPIPAPAPSKPRTHYSLSSLKYRGWTNAMVRDLLGEPDKRGGNPHYRTAPKTRLYEIERVLDIESSEAFTERKALADKRRNAAASRS